MKFYNILNKDLKLFFASIKFNILIFLVMPLSLGLVYGMLYDRVFNPSKDLNKINVAFVDLDNGQYAEPLKQIFISSSMKEFVNLKEDKNIKDVEKKLINGDYSTAVIIPEGFSKAALTGDKAVISVKKAASAGVEADSIGEVVDYYVSDLNVSSNIYKGIEESVENKSDIQNIMADMMPKVNKIMQEDYTKIQIVSSGKKLNSKQYFYTTFLALSSLFTVLIGAQSLLKERKDGTLMRMNSTAVKDSNIFWAKIVYVFLISLFENILLIIITSMLGIEWGDNFLQIAAACLAHSISLSGITGLFISIFRNEKMLNSVFMIFTIFMAMMGGTFYPQSEFQMPVLMKRMSELTLNYWVQKSYGSAMLGRSFTELLGSVLVLIVIGVLGMLIGRVFFRVSIQND